MSETPIPTPQQAAAKMVQRIFDEVSDHMTHEQAKACAVICMEEVMPAQHNYLLSVMREIEKL